MGVGKRLNTPSRRRLHGIGRQSVCTGSFPDFPAGFGKAVRHRGAEKAAKGFSCWDQFVAMLFCQLGGVNTLREICGGLATAMGKLRLLRPVHVPAEPRLRTHDRPAAGPAAARRQGLGPSPRGPTARITVMFLDQAEFRAQRRQDIYMDDWQAFLDKFLRDTELPV